FLAGRGGFRGRIFTNGRLTSPADFGSPRPQKKVRALVFSRGEAKRMGGGKTLIEIAGKPLWARQLDLLRRLQPSEIFVSTRADPQWRPGDVHWAEDAKPSRGPLSGIAACLGRIQTEHLLVLAVDMPFMTEECLLGIWAAVNDRMGVVPMIED